MHRGQVYKVNSLRPARVVLYVGRKGVTRARRVSSDVFRPGDLQGSRSDPINACTPTSPTFRALANVCSCTDWVVHDLCRQDLARSIVSLVLCWIMLSVTSAIIAVEAQNSTNMSFSDAFVLHHLAGAGRPYYGVSVLLA